MKQKSSLDSLRDQAEQFILTKPAKDQTDNISQEKLIHELQVHQIELEMQNEELRRTRDRLEKLSSKYADLYQFAPNGYFIIDENGTILEANLTGISMLGSSQKKVVGRRFHEFLNPEFMDTFYLHRRQLLEIGKHSTCELVLKNGMYVSIKSSSELVDAVQIRLAMTDITALRKSEESYRLLFEMNPVGAFRRVYDPARKRSMITDCNDAHARILGYVSREEYLKDSSASHFYYEDDWKNYMAYLLKNRKVVNYNARMRGKDGTSVWVLLNATVRDHSERGKELVLIDGTMTDITEQKKMEARLRSSQKKLRAMASEIVFADERSRQNFAAELHDSVVQTLGAAKMRAEFIKEYISQDGLDCFTQLKNMISQSITQARMIMAEMSPPVLNELGFISALEWLTEQIESQNDIAIHFETAVNSLPLIHEIQVLLFQSTRELLMNVVKHANATEAVVTVSTKEKAVRIEVKDNGKGFDRNKAFHADSSSGFGLFSIRERLKHFGGQLIIKSKSGKGSRVVVFCPTRGGGGGGG